MKWYYLIFKFILLLLVLNNVALFYIFWENIIEVPLNQKYIILTTYSIITFMIILFLVQNFFYWPIVNLELTIKKFYMWEYKNKNIRLKKSPNSSINYIISFFAKTLNTLRNIKDEFIHGKVIKSEVELWKEIQWKMLEKNYYKYLLLI